MRSGLCALAWVLLFSTSAWAERLPVRAYGLADGPPSTFVDHIVSDSRGLLWFSTRGGLARFDGSRFVTYGIEHGPPVPTVNYLLETRDNSYWVATNGGGVCRMDTRVVSTAQGEDRNGNLWLASLSGVTKLSAGGFLTYDEHDGLTADRIRALYEDANGQVFAVGDQWIVSRFDGRRFVSVPGSEGVRRLCDQHQRMQVIMLMVFAEEERIFESLCNGACGYLLKKTPRARVLESIREAHSGGSPMSPEIARTLVVSLQTAGPRDPLKQELTPHEARIIRMLADGDSYQDVGDRLGITVNTVRNYIRRIYEKLHVHTKSEAVSKALRGRLIP
jgi:DNA-binding NarL/FixJ family response regulator